MAVAAVVVVEHDKFNSELRSYTMYLRTQAAVSWSWPLNFRWKIANEGRTFRQALAAHWVPDALLAPAPAATSLDDNKQTKT